MSEKTAAAPTSNRLPFSDKLPLENQFETLKGLYFTLQKANDQNLRKLEGLKNQLDERRRNVYDGHNVAEAAQEQNRRLVSKSLQLKARIAELEAEKAADSLLVTVSELGREKEALQQQVADANKALNLFREFQRLVESSQ